MLQRDGGEDGAGRRRDHIGAVQQTADAHLEHHEVHPAPGVYHKRQGGDGLELGALLAFGLHFVQDRNELFQHGAHQLPVHQRSVDLDALPEIKDIGGHKQPGFIPGVAQHAFTHGGGAALSVGAGDVDEGALPFRMAQLFHQPLHPSQPLSGAQMDAAVDIFQRLLVGHVLSPEPSGCPAVWPPSGGISPAFPFRR